MNVKDTKYALVHNFQQNLVELVQLLNMRMLEIFMLCLKTEHLLK